MRGLKVLPKSITFFLSVLVSFSLSVSFAQNKGPGGVGVTTASGPLRAWYRGDAGVNLTGGVISSWNDQSGYGNNLTQTTNSRRPSPAVLPALNNQAVVRYGGSHFFNSSFSGPGVDNLTLFVVANGSSYQSIIRFQNNGSFFFVYPWEIGGGRTLVISSDGSTAGGVATGLVNNTNNVGVSRYIRNTANGVQNYRNGTLVEQRATVNSALPTQPFYSGVYNPGTSEFPTADVGEMIIFYSALNDAQMVIVQNYLAAKFNVTLAGAVDVYTMDNSGNGNYDFDVAGIGRVNATNIHNDAQGTGAIRVLNPTGLGDGEYLMWGRDNGAFQLTNTTDIPEGASGRLARTWRVSETGDVGNFDVDIDLTGVTAFASLSATEVATKLRLLVDTNNDGVFNNEFPLGGATSLGSNIYRFSGVSTIGNNMRFTFALGEPQTFYSLGSGAWEDNTKWSLSSDGSTGAVPAGVYPTRIDNVVINTGHNITVNNVADNGSAGMKPDDLGQANIGPFGSSNLPMFYQTGNIIIRGTLTVSGVEAMIGGYTWIQSGGTLIAGSNVVVTGSLQADSGSTLTTLDDIILTGYSTTTINTASTSSDDLIIDHTDATLCGSGTTTLQNGAGSTITYANGGTVNQICTSYQVRCTGAGCAGFPVNGTTVVITGNNGPAGVGSNAGESQLKIWYRVDNGLSTTGTNVDTWVNSAGIAALNISETAGQRPTLVNNVVNGYPEVSFNGSNRLRTGLTLTTTNFPTNQASSFVVNRADNTTQSSSVYVTDPLETNRFSNHIPWSNGVYFDLGQCCGNDTRLDIQGLTNLTNYSVWSYSAQAAAGKQVYRNGTLLLDRPNISTFISPQNYRFNLGGNTSGTGGYEGDITETIVFNARINTSERILIQNYLSAKYNVALTANDIYVQDNPAAGNYDYDVAGIVRAADGTSHKDSRGTGIVRMWGSSNLDANESLIWGSNAASLTQPTSSLSDVDGTLIKQRLTRVWRVSEVGDVGTVNLSFDITQVMGASIGSNLRLLIDRDGDGFQDNDVTPIAGSYSNNTLIFSSLSLQDGDYFTLGNTSSTNALPITLVSFEASARDHDVVTRWKTASELNNDHFEVEKSQDAEHWTVVGTIQGAGTTSVENNYSHIDSRPFEGRTYYRLKQVDYDGTYTYSRVVPVDFTRNVITIWPNPSTGVYNLSEPGVYVEVYNVQGKRIVASQLETSEATIDISQHAAGVYVLKVYGSDGMRIFRVVKN